MRTIRSAALGAAVLALMLSACSPGGSSASPASPAQETGAPASAPATGPSISTQLVFGGPPECPERPFCLKGLGDVYGLVFKEFVALDAGGPLTVEALKGGDIDVGLLFTSDPAILANDFVLLQDDKGLQLADNIVPVVRQEVLDADRQVGALLDGIADKLSQAELTGLNRSVTLVKKTPAEAAAAWLGDNGFLSGDAGSGKGDIVVGSTNFYEQEILAELYAQALEHAGYTVERKFQLGNREIVFPALESGEIDILAEYAATALEFVNGGAGEASADPAATVAKLKERLEPKGLTALGYAEATDQNGFVVTAETAATYGLTTVSDLARPAP
jgi:osmoprotectant transport system substrate-binding protein